MGKVKDFLGVMAEANKRLQLDAEVSHKDYDIEVLTGNETEYIEMDLMLGVADLHTPEAVAAAESAITNSQPVISLAASSTGLDSEDGSDDDDDNSISSGDKFKKPKLGGDDSNSNDQPKKRPKIVELQ
ncbi:hypothetical protein HHK36_009700 [Tetracentron sinense]|uniref:Uncharacterized protein n=1 Tax=Tetracentron sinense TaxID=13715 RepID=A0A834ZD69_TETSI|nr:hypothetical protein HHK36_009700 [Tetracentron sinense]